MAGDEAMGSAISADDVSTGLADRHSFQDGGINKIESHKCTYIHT